MYSLSEKRFHFITDHEHSRRGYGNGLGLANKLNSQTGVLANRITELIKMSTACIFGTDLLVISNGTIVNALNHGENQSVKEKYKFLDNKLMNSLVID